MRITFQEEARAFCASCLLDLLVAICSNHTFAQRRDFNPVLKGHFFSFLYVS